VPIAQELSADNAQEGLIVVRLHHSVQHQQQRVTDRCLFHNPSHLPWSVSGIRNIFIQPNESIRISAFTQSCLQVNLQASIPQPTKMGATRAREQQKTNRAAQAGGSSGFSFTIVSTSEITFLNNQVPVLIIPCMQVRACLFSNRNLRSYCSLHSWRKVWGIRWALAPSQGIPKCFCHNPNLSTLGSQCLFPSYLPNCP
jgi:hypothetical protein